jgi:hypothetical protein
MPGEITTLDPRIEIQHALTYARQQRHHPDCHCGNYRHRGAAYCTPAEATWCRAIDRLLKAIEDGESPWSPDAKQPQTTPSTPTAS